MTEQKTRSSNDQNVKHFGQDLVPDPLYTIQSDFLGVLRKKSPHIIAKKALTRQFHIQIIDIWD